MSAVDRTRAVEVGGLTMAFRRAGKGPPLVLVHGAMCDSRVWGEQLDSLSDEFDVVAWDAPGCGGSDDPPEDLTLAGYAECLAGFIEALGLGRPHVVGHSFGGGLVLQLAVRHPARVRSLVVVGGYAGWSGSLPPDEVDRRLAFALSLAEKLPVPVRPESVPGLVSAAMPPERLEELAAVMSDVRGAGARVMARAFAAADLRAELPSVRASTLVLYGSADERAGGPVAQALHAAIPGSVLVELPGVGHECYLEAPTAFNAEVRRFLRSVA